MSFDVDDTIVAIATAAGGAPRGIVRVSGPGTIACLQRSLSLPLVPSRQAIVKSARLSLAGFGSSLQAEIYLWPNQRSYTRQPAAEIHIVGSPPILEAVLASLCRAGARLAQPGEFTLRAFLGGRLDLTQVEAVLGVIDAQDQRELKSALSQLAGGVSRPLNDLREQLLNLLADLEAGLDFVDEDIEFITPTQLRSQLESAAQAVAALADRLRTRGHAGRVPRVVFRGAPNVGKSSLLNALTGESAALVSPEAGTTRDYISRLMRWEGLDLELVDTAGIEPPPSENSIAGHAQRISSQEVERADLTVLCLDASRPTSEWNYPSQIRTGVPDELVVLTKCDQVPLQYASIQHSAPSVISTSSLSGIGLDELRRRIVSALHPMTGEAAPIPDTTARCRESLELASQSLSRARELSSQQLGDEFVAAEIRTALTELGRMAGTVYTNDVLDRVFSRFCIGK